MRERFKEDRRYPSARRYADLIETFEKGSRLALSADVDVTFVETRHSTPDSCSLAFEWRSPAAPLRVIHTADFKLDAGRFEDGTIETSAYRVFGDDPDFLFVDSTNSERPGHSVSELDVIPGLERLVSEAEGRVFVTLFASNVYRIAALLNIAARAGRHVSFAGRSLQNVFRLAGELGLFDETADVRGARVVEARELARLEPSRQLVICSGSQGETRSALRRLAAGEHSDFVLEPGDRVIFSSKLIPGNERPMGRLVNGLMKRGAEVLWGDEAKLRAGGPIHASGHARSEEIRELLRTLRPRQVIPVHGEFRQLRACADLALREGAAWGLEEADVHLAENGTQLSFAWEAGNWRLSRRDRSYEAPGRSLRFEDFACSSKDPFLRVRKRAASGGCLVVSLDLGGRCRVSAEGMWPEEGELAFDREELLAEIEGWVHSRYRLLTKSGARPAGRRQIEQEAAEELARFVKKQSGLRPFVLFHWMESP